MIRPRLRIAALLAACALAAASSACGGGNAASQIAHAPDYDPAGQSKCSVRKNQAEPLVVEWPPAERGRLEAAVRSGLVAVHYSGCEMELRTFCHVKSEGYRYLPVTRKRDEVSIKDEDDLYAQLPVGAARLEGKLKSAGELHVDMMLVGRWEAGRGTVSRDELEGDCAGVTHIVNAVTVGAFTFSAGAAASVGAGVTAGVASAGGSSDARREMLTQDGDESACTASTSRDATPPDGCGALIRIEVSPVKDAASKAKVDVGTAAAAGGAAGAGISPWNPQPVPTAETEPPEESPTQTPQPAPVPAPAPTPRTRPVGRPPTYTQSYWESQQHAASGTGPSTVSTGGRGTAGTIIGWSAVGALAVGSGLALLAAGTTSKEIGDSSSGSTDCNSTYRYCNAAGLSAQSTAHDEALAADILLGVGAVGALVWWLWPIEYSAAPAPANGGASLVVRGRF